MAVSAEKIVAASSTGLEPNPHVVRSVSLQLSNNPGRRFCTEALISARHLKRTPRSVSSEQVEIWIVRSEQALAYNGLVEGAARIRRAACFAETSFNA